MRYFLLAFITASATVAFAENKITLSIDELNNIDRGHSLEACGTATHVDGTKPLLVSLTHDQSIYNTLTNEQGKWCVVFKRWNNSGKVTASASTLDFSEKLTINKQLRGN